MADKEWDSKSGLLIGYTLTGNDREGWCVTVHNVQLYVETLPDFWDFRESWPNADTLLFRELGHELTEQEAGKLLRWAMRVLQERSDIQADDWDWDGSAIPATRRKGGV